MQDAAGLVIIIVGAGRGVLGEVPEAVARARHDGVVARDRVQQRAAVRAVVVLVRAVDVGRGGLDSFHIAVDGAHLALLRRRLEPRREVVGPGAGRRVGRRGEGDGVGDASLQGAGLRGAA